MSNLTIRESLTEREKLKNDIRKLLEDFTKRTELPVTGDFKQYVDRDHELVYRVRVDIKNPF